MAVKVEDLTVGGGTNLARRAAATAWREMSNNRHTTEDRQIVRVSVLDLPADRRSGIDVSVLACCASPFAMFLRRNSAIVAEMVKVGTPWPANVTCEATLAELIQHLNELIKVAGETAIADGIKNGMCSQVEETLESIGIPAPNRRVLEVTVHVPGGHDRNGREFDPVRIMNRDHQQARRFREMLDRNNLGILFDFLTGINYVNDEDD